MAEVDGKTLLDKAKAYVEKHQIRPQSELVAFMAAFAQQERDDERERYVKLLDAIEAMRPFVTNPHNIPWNNILHHAAAIRARGKKGKP